VQSANACRTMTDVAVRLAQVHLPLVAEKQLVGDRKSVVVAVGKTVDAYILRLLLRAKLFVETLKQTAVHERNAGEQAERVVRVGVPRGVFWKADVIARPEIPVGQLLVKTLGDLFDIERRFPLGNPGLGGRVVGPGQLRQIEFTRRPRRDIVAPSECE